MDVNELPRRRTYKDSPPKIGAVSLIAGAEVEGDGVSLFKSSGRRSWCRYWTRSLGAREPDTGDEGVELSTPFRELVVDLMSYVVLGESHLKVWDYVSEDARAR